MFLRTSLWLGLAVWPAFAQTGDAILARVDRLRHPWPAFTVELTLTAPRIHQVWKVSARENGDARLEGVSPKEQGRGVLLKGDQMWLLLPNSRRPVKVSPQQRLMGPAAGGDVARTRFREDYTVRALESATFRERPCWRLQLEARRPALSARQVVLWVQKEELLPLQAEFYLASGRLARTATFGPPVLALGQPVLSNMELLEATGGKAELVFSRWSRVPPDPSLFELPDTEP